VGYSGATTRSNAVEAPALVTAGPYAYVRNPLYVGNFVTAAGFALAFTGRNSSLARAAIAGLSLGIMVGVYTVIVPHEEAFLRETFGAAFDDYAARVPRVFPAAEPAAEQSGSYDPSVIAKAESRTFVTLGAMLAALAVKALHA
jgi:protein-S-isoprenylcysteine O-methyltransferase Ste14